MRVGEVATLFIKSHYGYGSAGSPPKVFTLYSSKSLKPPFRFPEMLHWSLRLSFLTFMGKTSQRFRSLFCKNFECDTSTYASACELQTFIISTAQDKDMGVVKRTKVAGEGYDQPNDGSQVEKSTNPQN